MIFLFGTGSSQLGTTALPGVACAHCGNTNTLSSTVFSRYFSVFWIPVFPLGKRSVTVCEHCKQVLTGGELPASYRAPVQAIERQARVPLTNYALLLVFGAGVSFIVVVGGIFGKSDTAGPAAAAATGAAPSVVGASAGADDELLGHRYRIKLGGGSPIYSLLQVTEVTADTVRYRSTRGLTGPLSEASATLALRDSLAPGTDEEGTSKAQFRTMAERGTFERLD